MEHKVSFYQLSKKRSKITTVRSSTKLPITKLFMQLKLKSLPQLIILDLYKFPDVVRPSRNTQY